MALTPRSGTLIDHNKKMYTKCKEDYQVHPREVCTFIPNVTQPTHGVQNWKYFKIRAVLPFCKHTDCEK